MKPFNNVYHTSPINWPFNDTFQVLPVNTMAPIIPEYSEDNFMGFNVGKYYVILGISDRVN